MHGNKQEQVSSTSEFVSRARETLLPRHGERIELWEVSGRDSPELVPDMVRFPVACPGTGSTPTDVSQFAGGGILASCGACDAPFVFVLRTLSWSRT